MNNFFLGDPPGAPSTYPTNYPMMQNDLMNQSWTSHHDANNQYYPNNTHSMPPTSAIPYDPNQYGHMQNINPFMSQSQQMTMEDRPSKKVQFARPLDNQSSSFRNPLTGTQSYNEISTTNTTDVSTTSSRPEPIITRQSAHRPIVPKTAIPMTQIPLEKPIYVGIDHRATLAERGQITAHKHHHKNNPENGNNHRSRSHTHHQHKHQEPNDSFNTRNNIPTIRSFDPTQGTRTLTTTSTSTSAMTQSRSVAHIEQSPFNDNDIKMSRNRGSRQHTDRQTTTNNDPKSTRSRSSQSQQREPQQQRATMSRNNSPLRTEGARRVENKQPSTLILTAPISQTQHQSQSRQRQNTMPSTMIPTTNTARARV